MSSWATPADLPAGSPDSPWPQAPQGQLLQQLLDAAEDQCRDYAPLPVMLIPAEGDPVEQISERHTLAVIYQARELWAASKREGDVIGGDQYVIRARPLTASVKQLLRPASPRRGRIG